MDSNKSYSLNIILNTRGQEQLKLSIAYLYIYLISARVVYNIIICECENRKEMSDISTGAWKYLNNVMCFMY